MKKKCLGIIILALAALLLMGCSGRQESRSYAMDSAAGWYKSDAAPAAEEPAMYWAESNEGGFATTANGGLDSSLLGNVPGRKIIKNADLSLQTLQFDQLMTDISSMVQQLGGYIESANMDNNSYRANYLRYAYMTLRIPSTKLESFLNSIGEMANVTNKNIFTEDVTLSYVDTESRLQSLRVEQETLLTLLEKAESVEDIITIQNRLSEVRYQIESYESRLRVFDNQIDYSTVNLNIREVERETQVTKETPSEEMTRRLQENWADLLDSLERFGINFVSDLPYISLWVIILVVPGVVVLIATRKARKAARERKKARKAAKAAEKAAKTNQK